MLSEEIKTWSVEELIVFVRKSCLLMAQSRVSDEKDREVKNTIVQELERRINK